MSSSAPVAVGDEMPASEFGPLTRSHIVRYAGAGGDFNPIHHDEEFARSPGMPGVFGTATSASRTANGSPTSRWS